MTARTTAVAITGCNMPYRIGDQEAELYQRVRQKHCVNGQASHACSGRITLDRNGMTLSCPLCGDARGIYPLEHDPSRLPPSHPIGE